MTQKEMRRRLTMMDKVVEMKKELKTLLPEIEEDKYLVMLCHLTYYHRNKKQYYERKGKKIKTLTEAERILLDYLIKNNLNPKTTYRWFLVSRLPEDLKDKLRKGVIPVAEARRVYTNRIKQRESSAGFGMMEEINNIVKSL